MDKIKLLLCFISVIVSLTNTFATNVKLRGDWDYSIDYENCTVQIIGDEIVNKDVNSRSGLLKLQLRFTNSRYDGGQLNGNIVAECKFSSLKGGYVYSEIDKQLDFIPPKTGDYFVTIALLELIDDKYYVVDYLNFEEQERYNKAIHILGIIASGLNEVDNSSDEEDDEYYEEDPSEVQYDTPTNNYQYNNGGSNVPQLKQKKCSFCNGTGVSPSPSSIPAFGNTEQHRCNDCGKMVSATHGPHPKCPYCKDGFIKSY